tara:strand:+ start:15469 stop:16170 length:702 start_codon:yes stop_codon:yes gene_type:complete
MSRNSNSHFEGAIILDDTGTSPDGTGPISYVGFDKATLGNPDESAGPRISGEEHGGAPGFDAPRGSVYLPGTGSVVNQFVWHNIGTEIAPEWVRLIQEGRQPTPVPGVPSIESSIVIDLPDTGAVLTLDTDIVMPDNAQLRSVQEIITYKLGATGAAGCTIQVTCDPAGVPIDAFSVPFVINQAFVSPFMTKAEPPDLARSMFVVSGDTLRFSQAKLNVGDNNAVRVVMFCRL